MNFENNNNEVIKRISRRSLKSNKIRNTFAIIAIILTTFMLASVFSIGVSFAKNYKVMQLRMQGSIATTMLPNPTEKQIEKIKELNIFKSIGSEINVGQIVDKDLEKNKISISMKYNDENYWEEQRRQCVSDVKGNYPTKENEIMISTKSLEFLGSKNIKLGDKIKLSYKIKEDIKEEEFIISGIYTDYAFTQGNGLMLVSKEFVNNNKLSLQDDGILCMSVKGKYKETSPKILKENIILNKGQEFIYNYELYGDSLEYIINGVLLVGIIVLFIIVSGYLLIYNVIYISVIKDINFYGLLKTIGTSPKQIKKIVRGQVFRLSIIGIPIGLFMAALVSFGLVPLTISNFFDGYASNIMPNEVSFNPIIFILTTLFSFLTVILSCRKPAKIASSISPIEAMRYVGSEQGKKKVSRKSTNGGKLYKMAWYNVFRDKKRATIVFLSLFMGIITFLSVNTFVKSVHVQNYINRYLSNDFELQDNTLRGSLTNDNIRYLKNIEGVKSLNVDKAAYMKIDFSNDIFSSIMEEQFKNEGLEQAEINSSLKQLKEDKDFSYSWIDGVDDYVIERYNETAKDKIDLEEFKKGKIVLIEMAFGKHFNYDKFKQLDGKSLVLNSKDGDKKEESIIKLINDDEVIFNGRGLPRKVGMPLIYMSSSILENLNKEIINYFVSINVNEEYEPSIKEKLESFSRKYELEFTAKTERIKEFSNMHMTINVLGGGASVILLLIGLLNFINVMITGVNSRIKELSIMESIGMTKKQVKKMLTIEGLYYAGITTVFISTIGMAIVYGVAILSKKIADYAVFVFPTVPLLILIINIFIVCLVTPSIVFKSSSKKNITERIREME